MGYLLIDDCRNFGNIIARTADGGKLLLKLFNNWSISFYLDWTLGIDHDLGGDETGYDILKWAIEKEYLPSKIQLVTMNPVGKQNMATLLFDAGYNSNDNINFIKS